MGNIASLISSAVSTSGLSMDHKPSGGEASLVLPDLSLANVHGFSGVTLLIAGMVICVLGLLFGFYTFVKLRALPAHRSMLEVGSLSTPRVRPISLVKVNSCLCYGRLSQP